jgi:DNA helicase IV
MDAGEQRELEAEQRHLDETYAGYGHVVIDEAQNLTPMELRMAARRARGQSLTILGDLAQRTAEAGVLAWDAVLAEAGVTRHAVRELEISYRVPDEFLALAAPLVPSGSSVPRGVRTAPWAPVAVAADGRGLGDTVAEEAARLAREVGSVGVVAPTELMAAMRAALEPVGFADATRGPLGPAVNLLDPHVAKGLEFDAALVVEPAAIYDERPDGGPGGLYTALTRSTRALVIVHANALPPALADAPALTRRTQRS